MTPRPLMSRTLALVLVLAMLSVACGQTVLVREFSAEGDGGAVPAAPGASEDASGDDAIDLGEDEDTAFLAEGAGDDGGTSGGTTGATTGGTTGGTTGSATTGGEPSSTREQEGQQNQQQASGSQAKCAEEGTDDGVTEDRIVWGTILPLSGPTRPLGEQTARVMKRAVSYMNTRTHDVSRPDLNWGCPGRKGIYGREVDLKIAAISSDSEDDALQAMRRLVDVENAFLVRDCYLQASLMGPAHSYAERNGVTTFHCYPESLPQPQLAPHTWAVGTSRQVQAALMVGYMANELGRTRLGVLYDPTYQEQLETVRYVAEKLGVTIVREVEARAQTAVNGRRSEVIQLREANPDSIIVLDALNATYAGVAAGQLQWRPKDSGVAWACNNCWLKFQVDVCGENCETMITNSSGVPFEPYNDASKQLWDTKQQIFPNEPDDILTFAAILITSGLFIYTAEAGVDLTRDKLEQVFLSLDNYSGGGLPPITTSPEDHFGSKADWLIQFSGDSWPNGFSDLTGGFVDLGSVGVEEAWAKQ